MIRPGRHDITIPQRATFREQLRLKADGAPLNLTGYDAVAQAWDRRRTTKLAEFTIDWIDREDGRLDLVLSHELTRLYAKDGEWDLLLIEPGGDRHYWLEGKAYRDPGYSEMVAAPAPEPEP
jgi:hypothetical protein